MNESKNFTSGRSIQAPPTIPINHYFGSQTNKIEPKVLFYYSMLIYSNAKACFEHSNFFQSKRSRLLLPPLTRAGKTTIQKDGEDNNRPHTSREGGGSGINARHPTTSFLTATTLIYAIGAGVTAAAGTRLALQWILVKGFKLCSFQLPDPKRTGIVIYCHYLPVSGLGNLRACCLP